MQKRPNRFYSAAVKECSVDITYMERQNLMLPRTLSSFFGRAALIHMRQGRQMKDLFQRIIEQSLGGIYFFSPASL
jgi:hypothetical protein